MTLDFKADWLTLMDGKNCLYMLVVPNIAIILAVAKSNLETFFVKETSRFLEFLCLHVSISKWYHIEVLLTPFVIPQQMALKTVKNRAAVPQILKSAP